MAFAKKRTPQVEQLRPYLEGVGKNLTDKLYGPAGLPWGTTLAEFEALHEALGLCGAGGAWRQVRGAE